MRALVCLLLVGSTWGQTAPAVPVVRDAYRISGNDLVRSARLRGYLNTIVCRGEFDSWHAWRQAELSVRTFCIFLREFSLRRRTLSIVLEELSGTRGSGR